MSYESYSSIIDNIYVGDIFSTNCEPLLKNINCVVSLIDNVINHPNIDYLSIPIDDLPEVSIIPVCEKVYDYLEQNKGKQILVHCYAGGSRSVATVIYYIMKKYNKSYDEAYTFFQSKRTNITMNKGFISQLQTVQL